MSTYTATFSNKCLSPKDIIGTHQWHDHAEKVSSRSKSSGRNYQKVYSKNCYGATQKCCRVTTFAVAGAVIGGLATGIPSAGAGAPLGAALGFLAGGALGCLIEELREKCADKK